jgi:hypothetical protein
MNWSEALDRLGMMPEDAQLPEVVALILETAWHCVPARVTAQANAGDLVALWSPGAGPGLRLFVNHLRLGERRAADDALRSLALVGTSSTKIALMWAKLGWHNRRPLLRARGGFRLQPRLTAVQAATPKPD